MPLAAGAVGRACAAANVMTGRQLCRAELERFRAAAASGKPVTVACTQEAPLFAEVAGEAAGGLAFVNIRETAGWSKDSGAAGPKMAALVAAGPRRRAANALAGPQPRGLLLGLLRRGKRKRGGQPPPPPLHRA